MKYLSLTFIFWILISWNLGAQSLAGTYSGQTSVGNMTLSLQAGNQQNLTGTMVINQNERYTVQGIEQQGVAEGTMTDANGGAYYFEAALEGSQL